MPSKIGEAILVIKANAKGLKTGLDNAQKAVSSKLGKMEKRLQGFAGKIPIVGGELKGLGGPALIASAAIGTAVAAVAGMVKKTLDLGPLARHCPGNAGRLRRVHPDLPPGD